MLADRGRSLSACGFFCAFLFGNSSLYLVNICNLSIVTCNLSMNFRYDVI